jgi:MSHA biogenesis protein MshK
MRLLSIFLALACMAVATTAGAQALRDPTRPPATSGKGAAGKNATGWILQSVLISPERRYAIINGEVVPVGGSVGGAELIAVAAERVTLRTHEGLRVVQLFPDVTRLGSVDAGIGTKKNTPARNMEETRLPQRSGNPGVRNEKDK